MLRKTFHRLSTACLLIALAVSPLGAQERFYFRNVQGSGSAAAGGGTTNPGGETNAPATASVNPSYAVSNNAPVSVVPASENIPLPVIWSIAPALRSGLVFDPDTGAVSGATTIQKASPSIHVDGEATTRTFGPRVVIGEVPM